MFFALTALGAIIAAIGRLAGDGGAVATALIVAAGYIGLCFALFVLFFLTVRIFAAVVNRSAPDADVGSPFAEGQLPPQLIPPRDQPS